MNRIVDMKNWLLRLPVLACLIMGKSAVADELQIDIITEGDGAVAEVGTRVSVHYEGRLEDGEIFDASRPRGQPFAFTIGAGQVIRGWEQGVDGMKIGETRRLTIPPELGYGAAGAGGVIPPNATLVFEIELLDVSIPVTLAEATPEGLLQARADGVVIIDIRREEEWHETGIIEGAETVTAFQASGQVDPGFLDGFRALAPSPDTPIMLYCRSGSRTASLGNALIEQLGFTDVTHLTDGIFGWIEAGQQTVDYTP
ncbi:MAG: FKBP-type peptidyl-prolyl cis-trans isomerase [Candidatus Puniceispirillaceae bacterium]